MQYTLAVLKPDCVRRKLSGKAIDFIESHGFEIVALKKVALTRTQAENFYAVHKAKDFFKDLVQFMTSGPCIPMVLKKENAVHAFREIIGETDPQEAAPGTLRHMYATTTRQNIVHGSDSDENAKKEIAFYFPVREIID